MYIWCGRLPNGSLMEITKVPLDAVYDTFEDVPEDVSWKTKISCE